MNQDERYVITLTPEQEIITEQALELLARLHIGQFERIEELLCDPRDTDYCQRRDLDVYKRQVSRRAIRKPPLNGR